MIVTMKSTELEFDEQVEITIDDKIEQVRRLIVELELTELVSIVITKESTTTSRDEYIVTLEDGSEVTFKSTDEKSAKYRGYRIGRDNKEGSLKVISVVKK